MLRRFGFAGRTGFKEAVDPRILLIRQPERERRRKFLHLPCAAAANDGRGDSRMMQGPGNGDYAGRYAVSAADLAQQVDEFEVSGQTGLVELRAFFRQSSAGIAATRSALILPVKRPETMGE